MKKIVLITILASMLSPIRLAQACADPVELYPSYSFFNRDIVVANGVNEDYYLSFEKISDYYQAEQDIQQQSNLEEWIERVCENASPDDAAYIIYEASISEMEALLTATRSKNMPVPHRLANNSFARYLHQLKCLDTLKYLIFAKKCEPHVLPIDKWNNEKRDIATMQSLIHDAKRDFRKIDSHYIKLRYIYQLVRLAHYAGFPERALELYDSMMPKTDERESIIHWWIQGHKAGALRELGQNSEAAYLFAQVYANSPSKRRSSYLSFRIKTQEEWDKALLFCQSNKERIAMHTIKGSNPKGRSLESMQAIYNLDPTNPNLEHLLTKEVKGLEKQMLGNSFNSERKNHKKRYGISTKNIDKYLISLQAFTRKCRTEGKVARKDLWYIAEGYLELIAGDAYAALKTLGEAKAFVEDPILKEQLDIFLLAAKIDSYERVNAGVEDELFNIRKNDKRFRLNENFPDFMRDKLTDLYRKSGEPGKAYLCQNNIDDLRYNPREVVVNDLIKIVSKTDKTSLEKLLTQNEDGNSIDDALWDLKTNILMQQGKLEAAFETFKNIPRASWDDFGVFDPFRPTIKDCIECPHSKDSIDLFNKGQFIEELLDLEYKVKSTVDEDPAVYYFKIGIGLYNTTYFGHSWNALDYYRSGATWEHLDDFRNDKYGYFKRNRENLNVDRALYYFEKARLVAKSKELAAKATFMAAKCEMIDFYKSKSYKPSYSLNRIPEIPIEYRENYSRLQEFYFDTQFYEQIISECQYFAAYVGR